MSEQMNQEQIEAHFIIQRLYVKDLSYEAPAAPRAFQKKWEPALHLDVNTSHTMLEDHVYEVVLSLTATVKNEDEVAYLIEVKQAGIFTIQGVPDNQMDQLLKSFCPNILFPYAREVISSQVIRGSFPPLVLAPINFDALYLQEQEGNPTTITTDSTH